VDWKIKAVPAGKSGMVTLIVRVRLGVLPSRGGTGWIANGGETATVKIGNDSEYILNVVENPVPTVTLKVTKIWEDDNDALKLRPATVTMKLSNGDEYYLNAANNWTVTVTDLPMYSDGKLVEYSWKEQSVTGYTGSFRKEGNTTIFTNKTAFVNNPKRPWSSVVRFDDLPTPLGIGICFNHVGDNFD
jgi:hypothetical protein